MNELVETDARSMARRAVTWLDESRLQVAALVGSLFAIVGYLSIGGLADELDVAVADFAFDRSAHVLFIGFHVAFGVVLVAVIAAAAQVSFVLLDRVGSQRVIVAIGVVAFVAVFPLSAIAGDVSGRFGLLWLLFLLATTGTWCGAVVAWHEEGHPLRWFVVFVLAIVGLLFVVNGLSEISSEGREVASYARSLARGEQVDEPRSFLGLSVAPSRGRLTVGDEAFCVVRVSERVHLIVVDDASAPIETLIAQGDYFISDPDCS